ncbi:MAG: HAMP domain-containing sensor histidine kinase [Christensenella sp.]|nr:HAMP domain-containing sensor histidine kinase [Christensenella sp.]
MLPWILCGVLLLVSIVFVIRNIQLKKSMDEICAEFKAHLAIDTNTLISLHFGDSHAKRLASEINIQLSLLRKQRNQYFSGERELKDAITNISHDLRTPLTAICGYLDLLENEEMSENAARYLSYISNRAEIMKQLTEELFRYSIWSTQDDLELEAVCVNSIIEDCVAACYPLLTKRAISPTVRMPEYSVWCLLNKTAVLRVFGNVLNNALKYSDGDLEVFLHNGGEIVFTNTASRLDEVQVGKLFDRFFTVEAARNSTGLGLSISKMLVERMGGTISAKYADGRLSICIAFPVVSGTDRCAVLPHETPARFLRAGAIYMCKNHQAGR